MTNPTETNASTKSEHLLPGKLLSNRVNILLIGCGGTGGTVASGLVHLHQALLAFGHPYGLHVTLVDGDKISPTNCVRQPFSESEIGLYKADVLATRINLFWGLAWNSDIRFLDEGWTARLPPDFIISCVDTRKARKLITQSSAYQNAAYWLDLGNNAETGQFVLGEPHTRTPENGKVRLPNVADLFPEIIDERLDAKDKLPSCSAVEALEGQSPFVNQTLAYQALAMLAQLFRRGKLSYHGGFANLTTGRVSPLPIDPTVWQRIRSSQAPTRSRRGGNDAPAKHPA
jgi:PRTRC genetic system ThiF family protein